MITQNNSLPIGAFFDFDETLLDTESSRLGFKYLYLLEPVAEDLGFHHLLCTDLEIGPDGLLTGRAKGPLCLDSTKRVLAEKLAEEANIDLSSSYAYGNHQSDLPLLELVGHPYVVEPTGPLKNEAIKNEWPILTYR
jgi:phosphoserine phosphatase